MKSAREAVLLTLIKMEKQGAYSNLELKKELGDEDLSPKDKSLFKQLLFGTLEKKYLLDYYIAKLSIIKPHKMSPFVINILRTGIYQLEYLDKIPQSAACNEAVNLSRIYAKSASGFVNAILRNFLRNRDTLQLPDKQTDPFRYLSIKYSVEKWIVNTFIKAYGAEEAENLLICLNKPYPIFGRINTLKTDMDSFIKESPHENIISEPVLNFSNAIKLNYSVNIENTSVYRSGLFHLQGLSSQICCSVLDPKPGHTVLDICAAPGGKSFTIAQMMNNEGILYSNDLYEHKIKLINYGAKRLGINIIKTSCSDASEPLSIPYESCDRVLCDAPCSGIGIIPKKPEIRYKGENDVKALPDIQLKILTNASKYLKKGGFLCYSTCTINPLENENIVKQFLDKNNDFILCDINGYLPMGIKSENTGYITLLPYIHGTEGFFIALIKRKNG